jgi:hypothetical protein
MNLIFIFMYFQSSVIHQDFLRFVHVDDQQMLENNLKLVPSPPEQVREIFKQYSTTGQA